MTAHSRVNQRIHRLLIWPSFSAQLAFIVLFGIGLRLYLAVSSGWRIDYDEAMVGLLGMRVLRGEFMAFIPAQATLGAVEPYLLAPLFVLFGATTASVRILSLLLSAACILTTGLLARTAFDEPAGIVAALLAAVAPPYMLVTGMKVWGGTIETIVLGNGLLLAAHYVMHSDVPRGRVRLWLFIAGLIAGLMFWIAWLGFYYFVPVGLLLVWRGRRALSEGWWVALMGFVIGSAPFWIYNLTHEWATFTQIFGATDYTPADMGAIIHHLRADLVPRLVTGDAKWGSGGRGWQVLPVMIYYAGLLALLGSLKFWPRASGRSLRWMLALFVLVLPLMYLFSGYGQTALNPWGLDATGRYVLMLHTALPVGVAALAVSLWRAPQRVGKIIGVALTAAVIGANGLGLLRTDPARAFDSPYYDRLPANLQPLIDYLNSQGVRHVWLDNGIGHVLMFQTQERILAADYYDTFLTDGFLRFPDVLEAVEQAGRTAFVVPVYPDQQAPPIERALDSAGIGYTAADVLPTLRVYLPDEHLDPAVIAAGLGYQY